MPENQDLPGTSNSERTAGKLITGQKFWESPASGDSKLGDQGLPGKHLMKLVRAPKGHSQEIRVHWKYMHLHRDKHSFSIPAWMKNLGWLVPLARLLASNSGKYSWKEENSTQCLKFPLSNTQSKRSECSLPSGSLHRSFWEGSCQVRGLPSSALQSPHAEKLRPWPFTNSRWVHRPGEGSHSSSQALRWPQL